MKLWPLFGVALARYYGSKCVKRGRIIKNPDPNNNQNKPLKSEIKTVKTLAIFAKIAYSLAGG